MWCRPSPSGCAPVPVAEERLVHTCKVAVMHRSMGKGPLIFVLDKARFPYDLVKAAVDPCRSRMRLDMALSQKFDNLLGILGAGAFFIGVVVFVMAPFLIVPAVFALVFPGCSLDSPWTWQTVIVGGLVLFALGIGVSLLMGVLARVIAPLGHLVVNKVTKESLEFLVLWWFYSTLMLPVSYAFGASVVVTIVTAVTEPILDRALQRQKHATSQS